MMALKARFQPVGWNALSFRYTSTVLHCITTVSRSSKAHWGRWRALSSTARQLTDKRSGFQVGNNTAKSKATPNTITRLGSVAKINQTILYNPVAKSLASRPSPTLLYQASSPLMYLTWNYLIGGFCFAYAGFNFYTAYLYPPPYFDAYLGIAVGGICVAMVAFGSWYILGNFRLIKSITAIPAMAKGAAPLSLRFDHSAMLPGIRSKTVLVPYNEVVLLDPLLKPISKMSAEELLNLRIEEEQKRKKEKTQILTLPFRQAAYWTWRGFDELRNALWKDRYIFVQIKGRSGLWKLHKKPAWALDNGRALDRLVNHRLGA